MKHIASIFVVLATFWLINSGLYKPLILGLGLVSVLFVIYLTHRMDVIDHESQPLHLFDRKLPAYYLWLMRKIIASNADVVRRIWAGPGSISPCVERIAMDQTTDMGKVIYANSMTLTPGTVAMDIRGDTVIVHALTRAGMDEIVAGEMNRRVAGLER